MDVTSKITLIIKEKRPLIHSITNYVTVNDCANALLAIGARPVMSHDPLEAGEITAGSDALELNLGATEYYESMLISGKEADSSGIPILIDPVGVSGSTHRRNFLKKLINDCHPVAIRGNRSEILAIIRDERTETGVDSVKLDSELSDEGILSLMKEFCKVQEEKYAAVGVEHQLILVCSGKTDLVASSDDIVCVSGGSAEMSGVTGTGCMSSVIMAAFISAAQMYNKLRAGDAAFDSEEAGSSSVISSFDACAAAVRYINSAAERAEVNLRFLREKETLPCGTFGSGSYRVLFIDQLNGAD